MRRWHTLALAAASALILTHGAAQAAAFKSVDECKAGRRVADSQEKAGAVLGITQGTMCTVRLDADGGDHYYLFWMLHAAGGSAETDAKLVAGKYECFSFSGGRSNYDFVDIVLTSPTTYRSGRANGRLHVMPKTRQIVFETGPFAGKPAKLLDGPSIGFSATTCQLAK